MRINKILPAILLGAMLCCSCIKEKLEVGYNNQEAKINTYIENTMKKDSTYTTININGANRLTLKAGEGEELDERGNISFYYAGYVFSSGYNKNGLFATNHETTALDAGWNLTDKVYEALTINLQEDKLLEGLRNGLRGVKAGEECEIIFSGKYGYGNEAFGIIPANSALLYKIWVISVSND